MMAAANTDRHVLTVAGREITLVGDAEDTYFRSLPAFHASSPQLESYARSNLGAASVCLDVGANIGLTAILLSLVCPQGKVFAFEASPRNARYLRENLRRNGIENCVAIESAVGSHCGSVAFRESVFGAGSHVVSGRSADDQAPADLEVPVTTLDAFVERGSLVEASVDFIKLDVEGYEPAVLAGAARLLERDRPKVFMEFNAWCLQLFHGFNHAVFAHALAEAFAMARIDKDGALTPVSEREVYGFLYSNMMQHGCVDDVVLQLKAGTTVPLLAEMTKSAEDLRNLRELLRTQVELRALRSLQSWLGANSLRALGRSVVGRCFARP